MRRRQFISRTFTATAAGLTASYWSTTEAHARKSAKDTPLARRPYKDEIKLSIIGCGGIVFVGQHQEAANEEVAKSIDRGVNYFDVAPSYGKGEAERKLGHALKPYRDKVFLAEKTGKRDANSARIELEQSLKTLQTDHFDLYQFHAITSLEQVEQILRPGGAMETFVKAREQGKIRYIGFSAHNEEAALKLLDSFPFDSVLFPINYVCWARGNFGPRLLAKAKEKKVPVLALKALAFTPWANKQDRQSSASPKCWYRPIEDYEQATSALRFTLSEGVTAAIPPGDERIYRIALDIATAFQRLSSAERKRLLASADSIKPIFSA
jgi:predicted aldo/keto reductase-like oxidoreductase